MVCCDLLHSSSVSLQLSTYKCPGSYLCATAGMPCRSVLAKHQLADGHPYLGLVCRVHHLHRGASYEVPQSGESNCLWSLGLSHGGTKAHAHQLLFTQLHMRDASVAAEWRLSICYHQSSGPYLQACSPVHLQHITVTCHVTVILLPSSCQCLHMCHQCTVKHNVPLTNVGFWSCCQKCACFTP